MSTICTCQEYSLGGPLFCNGRPGCLFSQASETIDSLKIQCGRLEALLEAEKRGHKETKESLNKQASEPVKDYPEKPFQTLFEFMYNEHDKILTTTQMADLIKVVGGLNLHPVENTGNAELAYEALYMEHALLKDTVKEHQQVIYQAQKYIRAVIEIYYENGSVTTELVNEIKKFAYGR